MAVTPQKILLATDLSVRSDRAQDRAVSLLKQYNSELVVLHVLESMNEIRHVPFSRFQKHKEKSIDKITRELLDYLIDVKSHVTLRVEEGIPHEIILKIAEEENCDLIVSGVARSEILGRFTLGKTVNQLMRKSDIPVLVVTERVRGHYKKIVVVVDSSEISKRAIKIATNYFSKQILTLLKTYTTYGESLVDNASYKENMREVVYDDLMKFLDSVDLTADQRKLIKILIEYGSIEYNIRNLLQLSDVELVVVGSHKRSFFFDAFFDSEAKRIIATLTCDVLIVR
jgi:nucleotide-binding universal stress UspA family protein